MYDTLILIADCEFLNNRWFRYVRRVILLRDTFLFFNRGICV